MHQLEILENLKLNFLCFQQRQAPSFARTEATKILMGPHSASLKVVLKLKIFAGIQKARSLTPEAFKSLDSGSAQF